MLTTQAVPFGVLALGFRECPARYVILRLLELSPGARKKT